MWTLPSRRILSSICFLPPGTSADVTRVCERTHGNGASVGCGSSLGVKRGQCLHSTNSPKSTTQAGLSILRGFRSRLRTRQSQRPVFNQSVHRGSGRRLRFFLSYLERFEWDIDVGQKLPFHILAQQQRVLTVWLTPSSEDTRSTADRPRLRPAPMCTTRICGARQVRFDPLLGTSARTQRPFALHQL